MSSSCNTQHVKYFRAQKDGSKVSPYLGHCKPLRVRGRRANLVRNEPLATEDTVAQGFSFTDSRTNETSFVGSWGKFTWAI